MPPNNADSGKSHRVDLDFDAEKCSATYGNVIGHAKSQTNVNEVEQEEEERERRWDAKPTSLPQRKRSVTSLLDELLCDIYNKMEVRRRTSATTCDLSWQDSDHSKCSTCQVRSAEHWMSKDITALKVEKSRLEMLIAEEGHKLVKQLKRKNFLSTKREAHCDVITAYIQALSSKKREDTKMKFSLTPGAETGFSQWLDAMKMVAQLPEGMPPEFRTKLWLQLSEKHLNDKNIDWEKAEPVIFNEWTNPDDEELGVQIVKDLHRTGCSLFCGEQEHNQALLKRVLLAYARWNKNVGYCQGFNMLAALILQVMDKDEKNAVKVMIYLIEGVLPESYFANNLRGLSVDMAVFRDLLRLRLPRLSKHLEALQHDTNAGLSVIKKRDRKEIKIGNVVAFNDDLGLSALNLWKEVESGSGTSYEPPLTNVFTMQWFLTLFSNCLPQQTVLRVWDLVFLYGNEVLLRTALAIWGILQDRVITVESADEFYSIMGVVTREMLEFGLMDANTLVKMIAMVDPFPNELQELRDKYLYNISPWTQSVQSAAKKGIRLFYSDPEDQDDTEDEDKIALATAYGVFRRRESASRELQVSGPTLDISVLKQQYAKLRERQRQAHVIITAACSSSLPGSLSSGPSVSVNHLLLGKSALVNKGRRIGPPEGSIPPPSNRKGEAKDAVKPKVSGETYHWKDAERLKVSKQKINNRSNKKEEIRGKEERRTDKEEREKTNHDRTDVTEESVEDSFRRKPTRRGSSSSSESSSSTSTELCDEEMPKSSDFDSEDATNSDASSYFPENSPRLSESLKQVTLLTETLTSKPEVSSSINEGCDKDNLTEIKTFAATLVDEIEEKLQASEELQRRLGHRDESDNRKRPPEVTTDQFDNTISLLDGNFLHDNILKAEPEVPIRKNVIEEDGFQARRCWNVEEESTKRDKFRRKSDLGLSVIRENLEMLNKFSQKAEKAKSGSFETEEENLKSSRTNDRKTEEEVEKEESRFNYSLHLEQVSEPSAILLSSTSNHLHSTQDCSKSQAVQNYPKTEPEDSIIVRKPLVEKAISPIVPETTLKPTVKVNKEVNTEITFGVDEVDIAGAKPSQTKTAKTERFRGEEESFLGEREGSEIRTRIEVSKSDWELKMRKIAELETTTRETLNEIQAQSMHRKSGHRSLDRITRRSHFDENFDREPTKSPDRPLLPKIQLDISNESSNHRKSKISSLSFDAITSRTEKLLGKMEFNRSTDDTVYTSRLSPEMEFHRKPRDSTSKFKKLIEESYGGETGIGETEATTFRSKAFEFHSSPTSPEFRSGSTARYSEYSSPRYRCESKGSRFDEEDVLRVTQNGSKTSVDLVKRKYSPETVKPETRCRPEVLDVGSPPNRANFNPFPTRTQSRPKELGVKLGLYPTTPPEGTYKKS